MKVQGIQSYLNLKLDSSWEFLKVQGDNNCNESKIESSSTIEETTSNNSKSQASYLARTALKIQDIELPLLIKESFTARKILDAGGNIKACIDPDLPDSVSARIQIHQYPTGRRNVLISYRDKESSSNFLINNHELRHLSESQGIVDPVLDETDSRRIMSFAEYVLRRAEIEFKAEYSSLTDGSLAKSEARSIYRELRKLRKALEHNMFLDLSLKNFDRVKHLLTKFDIQNYQNDYQANIHRNLESDPLLQTSNSSKRNDPSERKRRKQEKRAKLQTRNANQVKTNLSASKKSILDQIRDERKEIFASIKSDPEFSRFFPKEECDIVIQSDFKTKLLPEVLSCRCKQDLISSGIVTESGTNAQTAYEMIIQTPESSKAVPVFANRGFISSDKHLSNIATIIAQFALKISNGLEVQGGHMNGASGAGLLHSFERHCRQNINDISILIKKSGKYYSASQFARPINQDELLGIMRYAANNLLRIDVDPQKGFVTLIGGVSEVFGLGCSAVSLTFAQDGKFISILPIGSNGNFPQLSLLEYDSKKCEFVKNEQGSYTLPKEAQLLPILKDGMVYKPVLISPNKTLWSDLDTVNAHKSYWDANFEDKWKPH